MRRSKRQEDWAPSTTRLRPPRMTPLWVLGVGLAVGMGLLIAAVVLLDMK